MMECNREEGLRARRIALMKLKKKDFRGAQRIALKAKRLYPELENLSQLLAVCEVHCAALSEFNGDLDWYGILQVDATANDEVITQQYCKLSCLLHPDKNTLPGAEAAFKLVCTAHKILCDHMMRFLYDIKTQHVFRKVANKATHLSDSTHENKGDAIGHRIPSELILVFRTICPHCQKQFLFYRKNIFVHCDDCGRTFFAFKLHEEAVPLRFLPPAPYNGQVSLEMLPCHSNQWLDCTKFQSTGGNKDSRVTMNGTQLDEHVKWDVRSCDDGEENFSEIEDEAVQLLATDQTNSKDTTKSMTLEPNLSREDACALSNTNVSGSCSLQRFDKRKQDDDTGSSHIMDSCNNKRHRICDSVPNAKSGYIYPKKGEVWALYKGWSMQWSLDTDNHRSYEYEVVEVLSTMSAADGATVIPLVKIKGFVSLFARAKGMSSFFIPSSELLRFSHSISFYRTNGNEKMGVPRGFLELDTACLPADLDAAFSCVTLVSYMYLGNMTDCVFSDLTTESAQNKMDCGDDGNAEQEGSKQKFKKDVTDIANQMHCNSVISYECSDIFDFGTLREVYRIAVNQIWAIYDGHDSMPRKYAQINHVDASNNTVQLTWLEHNTMNLQETRLNRKELPVACGNFCLGETCKVQDPSMCLSHKVSWLTGKNRNSFEIHPKKGEIWALYKKSSLLQSRDTHNHQSVDYDVVEVSDDSMSVGIIVCPLIRVEGFVSLFAESKDKSRILIPSSEFLRFSHSIPCYRTNGNEKVGLEGLLELDTAALPCDLATTFPSITLDSLIDLNKKEVSEFVGVIYPDSEFYNFDEDRMCEKFERGQIWALYSSTDTFPNLYGWINNVDKEPFKVNLTWLEACPQVVDKHWLEQDIPVSCGKFVIRNSTTEQYKTCAFSHLVVSRCKIGREHQVNILPKVGEVWAIYKNWAPDWVPSSKDHPAKYAIGEIKMCTEVTTLIAFLTKVDGHLSVFKHDVLKGAVEIPRKENLRFSHRIPSFRLTTENGGKLCGFYELDPAAVPDVLLKEGPSLSRHF